MNFVVAGLLAVCAIVLYLFFYRRSKNLVDPAGLLSLFWLGGVAVASLKLSKLSADRWAMLTWASVFGFYIFFLLGYLGRGKAAAAIRKMSKNNEKAGSEREIAITQSPRVKSRLYLCIIVMTFLPLAAFTLEACILGFIPALIKNTPHAYSTFHITGVHYFTVSSCFVHPLTLLYLYTCYQSEWKEMLGTKEDRKKFAVSLLKKRRTYFLIWFNIIAIMIPVLIVSRYFLIMSVALTLVTFLSLKKNLKPKNLILLLVGCFCVLVPAYVLLTVFRAHSVEYLNGIFEMKNADTPIFITQPYMYIANNYENLNCLVEQLPEFAFGRRMLFPLVALTGMKFLFPSFVPATLYVTKTELTTVTLIYDAYYDFGLIGVLGFGLVLGAAADFVASKTLKNHNPIAYLIYAQIVMYLVLSFFTTWFSNPQTWFWLAISVAMYLFVGKWDVLAGVIYGKKNAKKPCNTQ